MSTHERLGSPAARLTRAIHAAAEVVGWLFILSVAMGGLHVTKIEWVAFFSGGLWIGLPLAYAIRAALTPAPFAQEGR